jgi:hypothetical protein
VAYPYVDPERQKSYLNALKRYADDYAMQWQLPDGGFSNARWKGNDMMVPYSVATGNQGMSFCSLYAITGEQKYLKIAERAVRFLLDNWQENGRPIHHHHAIDSTFTQDVTAFGDIYYYHEAILWVWHWTKDPSLKNRIRQVYSWHIKGSNGLLQARENGVWWPVNDAWSNSKSGAMPLVFIAYDRHMGYDEDIHKAVGRCTRFLCNSDFSRRVGIMCDPKEKWGEFSLSSTGFGGISLAELIKPGIVYLKSDKASRVTFWENNSRIPVCEP